MGPWIHGSEGPEGSGRVRASILTLSGCEMVGCTGVIFACHLAPKPASVEEAGLEFANVFARVLVQRQFALPARSSWVGERRMHQHFESSVVGPSRRLRSGTSGMKRARRDHRTTDTASGPVLASLRLGRREGYAWCLAKRGQNFLGRSRSIRSSRLSLRKRVNSSRSLS
jgi:hypothetical protein